MSHVTRLTLTVLFFVTSLAPSMATAQTVPEGDPALARLVAEIERLEELSGGTMGVAAIDLETGREAYLNPDEAFPMASTYKVPIAVQVLYLVDEGELSLAKRIEVEPEHLSPGSGMITTLLDDPGVWLSLHNLLELMLLISDNSATDLCLHQAGGADAVTARMRALGLDGIRVDRPTLELIADWLGMEELPAPARRRREDYEALFDAIPEEAREKARRAFEADPQDTATPRDIAALLEMIWRGNALGDSSTELLLDIMERCRTGENRLKGLLPKDTVVAHKTGTIGRTTNDVGIITLPHEAGHVIVVAFIKESELEVPERERAIAEVARAAHDYFLFTTEQP